MRQRTARGWSQEGALQLVTTPVISLSVWPEFSGNKQCCGHQSEEAVSSFHEVEGSYSEASKVGRIIQGQKSVQPP